MAAPPESAKREYFAFLRGPVGLNTVAFGTADAYRAGVAYLGLMTVVPAPVDNALNDFGIQEGGGFTVEIADEGSRDWELLLEDFGRFVLEDGSGVLIMEY